MAKQQSILPLTGTIQKITFYYDTIDGVYRAKEKSHLDGERVRTDPAFLRTRENAKEFGNAAKAGQLLRESITSTLAHAKDRRVSSRLVKNLMAVVHTDTTSERGERVSQLGDLTLLQGFNYNKNALLSTTMDAPYTVTLDRTAGSITIDVPPFVPKDMLRAPEGATHFKLAMTGSEVDFDNATFNTDSAATAILPWDSTPTLLISQALSLTAGTVLPLFANLGIQWFELVNGNYYMLNNSRNNCLAIVKVDQL